MVEDDDLMKLRGQRIPAPDAKARTQALAAAMQAFEAEKNQATAKGTAPGESLTQRAWKLWSEIMKKKMTAAPALAGLLALPVAGYVTYALIQETPVPFGGANQTVNETEAPLKEKKTADAPVNTGVAPSQPKVETPVAPPPAVELPRGEMNDFLAKPAPKAAEQQGLGGSKAVGGKADGDGVAAAFPSDAGSTEMRAMPTRERAAAQNEMAPPQPTEPMPQADENTERVEAYKTNPVKAALESPVSTFSIDVDTASYSFVRRSLKEGMLPQADTVRVEEMINYFPYDWKGPDKADTPFNSTVSVMPTPWNPNTKLMHVAIKGFDVKPAEQPKANLVFLIDVSGSMDEPDKLPLLRSAFRMLVGKLRPDDTVSIVTYAGNAGTVLEPTKASDKAKILNAIDTLTPGGSTAGEAGIREAYRLAQQSFVKDGVNRVMLATDGDFNVGQSDDDDLKRLIEDKRDSGVFLSVFGFGRGNLNDQMMQTIAQNGNGTAAYIDTLQEAEKVLVEDASSTLFTIAKDVKIQVEFNPAKVSEYRLIGYETRALNREDFNNDKVDAGEIGSGHSVTAIYEVTPKGSAAQQIDDLRYGEATTNNAAGIANADEYAFVKIRYKLPDQDISKLITTPVTSANEIDSFDVASTDQRFSVAVAAFGQKLRGTSQTDGFSYDRISEIATAARGADPFGYRAEFLSLVRLASALDASKR